MPLTSRTLRFAGPVLVATVITAAANPAASPAAAIPARPASSATSGGDHAGAGTAPDVVKASFAPGSTWKPETAVYGTASHNDVPVTMSDGTMLRANVIYPTDPATGQAATARSRCC